MDICERLRVIRTKKGYSQMDIAEVLDMQQQQYSRYETGQNEIPVRHIITLCKFYSCKR